MKLMPNRSDKELGRRVRNIWIVLALKHQEETGVKAPPHHLTSWEELDEHNRYVDIEIGRAMYSLGMSDTLHRVELRRDILGWAVTVAMLLNTLACTIVLLVQIIKGVKKRGKV